MVSAREHHAMRRAIALSARGLGTTSPNPQVGCVILGTDGRAVGEGYHRRKGEAHAEVLALTAAGHKARGGTAVVTLEPCNHAGRTPPCHQALLDAGIARTVVALIDPTSRGAGGVARLRKAGMDVEVGVLADEARLVLGPWLASLETRRPYVVWAPDPAAAPPDEFDAVLHSDGRVTEAVAGSHGAGALDLAGVPRDLDPHAALSALYDAGVRRLLLQGQATDTVAPFLAVHLVDRIVARPTLSSPDMVLIPSGFRVVGVGRCDGHVRVVAVRDTPPLEEGR